MFQGKLVVFRTLDPLLVHQAHMDKFRPGLQSLGTSLRSRKGHARASSAACYSGQRPDNPPFEYLTGFSKQLLASVALFRVSLI